jgi:metacaspase-1
MRSRAVIVGINQYQMPGCDLQGCVPDAERYANILVNLAGYNREDVTVLLNSAATTQAIKDALNGAAAGLADDDHLIFINSSHGAQTEDGNARTDCLCPHDFDWSPDRLISADWLHEFVSGIPSSVRIRVVIDACHSGDALRDGMPRPGAPVVTGSRTMPGSPVFDRHHGRHLRFRDLTKLFPSAGFIAACRSSETAADARFVIDGRVVFQGALSWFLAEQLEAPKGLVKPVRLVTSKAFKALREAGYKQRPVLRGPWEEISQGFTRSI